MISLFQRWDVDSFPAGYYLTGKFGFESIFLGFEAPAGHLYLSYSRGWSVNVSQLWLALELFPYYRCTIYRTIEGPLILRQRYIVYLPSTKHGSVSCGKKKRRFSRWKSSSKNQSTSPLLCLFGVVVCCLCCLYRSLAILSDLKKHTHPPKPLFWGTVPPTSRNPRETCLKAYMLLPPGKMTPSIRLRCFTAKPQSFCFKTFRVCLDVPLEVRING